MPPMRRQRRQRSGGSIDATYSGTPSPPSEKPSQGTPPPNAPPLGTLFPSTAPPSNHPMSALLPSTLSPTGPPLGTFFPSASANIIRAMSPSSSIGSSTVSALSTSMSTEQSPPVHPQTQSPPDNQAVEQQPADADSSRPALSREWLEMLATLQPGVPPPPLVSGADIISMDNLSVQTLLPSEGTRSRLGSMPPVSPTPASVSGSDVISIDNQSVRSLEPNNGTRSRSRSGSSSTVITTNSRGTQIRPRTPTPIGSGPSSGPSMPRLYDRDPPRILMPGRTYHLYTQQEVVAARDLARWAGRTRIIRSDLATARVMHRIVVNHIEETEPRAESSQQPRQRRRRQHVYVVQYGA